MDFKISLAAVTGRYHLQEQEDCQDMVCQHRSETCVCAALADGAGSRAESGLGARIVTETVSRALSSRFDEFWAMDEAVLAETLVNECLAQLRKQGKPLYDMACTLLAFAADESGRFLTCHLGDGIIVMDDFSRLSLFSAAENGVYLNETYFITGADAVSHLRIRRGTLPDCGAMLLMSDGAAESLSLGNGAPADACRRIAAWLYEGEEEAVSEALSRNMREVMSKRSVDDMSLAVIAWDA